jgi:hypothetical protein
MKWFVDVKRRSLNLLYCLSGSVLGIFCLSVYSDKINHSGNGFIRLAPPHGAIPENIRDLGVNSYYLAGGTDSRFFLGNYTAPQLITAIDLKFADSSVRRLSMTSAGGRFARSLKTRVDSPNIYLFEGVTPTIVHGTIGDSLLSRTPERLYFNLGKPLSPVSRILRIVDGRHQNILVKQLNDSIILGENVLVKQVDGIFCTEGTLHVQPIRNRLVYVYNYRNQFVVMDTCLRIRYTAHTIDTVSQAKFTVRFVSSTQSLTLSSPPLFVNKESCVSDNYLFIHSGLHADNEEMTLFQTNSAVDVYSLIDGKYLMSFYLPDYKNNKVRDFSVLGNTLIALYGQYVYSFRLNIPAKLQR